MTAPVVGVTMYFDPSCAWGWRASRWLAEMTGKRDVGPILGPRPEGEQADRVWDVVVGAATLPEFFALTARRSWRRPKRGPLTDHARPVLGYLQ